MNPATRNRIASLSPLQRQLLQRQLAERRGGVEPRPGDEPVHLSSAQQRLWMLDRLTPGSSAFNAARLLALSGDLDLDVLRGALDEIVTRHEVLRTRVAGGSEGLAVVDPPRPISIDIVDLSDVPGDEVEAATDVALRSFLRVPFRLEHDLLIRAAVVRRGPRDHVLALCTHHMASDDTSRAILLHELGRLYAAGATGTDAALDPVRLQYADFARWQHRHRNDQRIADQVEWWSEQLAGAPTSLDLPTDHPRPTLQSSAGARLRRSLPPEVAGRLSDMCRDEGVTLFMGALAVFAAVLSRYANQEDIVVGTPVSVRHGADIEAVMGIFTNNLALRVDLSGDPTFNELLHRVQRVVIDAVAHQDAPFERVVEAVQPPRDLSRSPLFQVMINSVRRTKGTEVWGPLEVSPRELDAGTCQVDLALVVEEHESGFDLLWEWCTDLFDEATVVRLAEHLAVMASAVVDDPSRPISHIDLLTGDERERVLVEWNPPATPVPAGAVHELIAARCHLQPTAVAVVAADGQLTYAGLEERANRLALLLGDQGVGPGSLVGVCLDRTLDLVPSLLAVLKAGAAYVPLDPEYPTSRLDHMLNDSGASIVITVTTFADALGRGSRKLVLLDELGAELEAGPAAKPDGASAATDLAYVIYTSGSSGTPKGVMIEHGAITNFLTSMADQPGVGPADVLVAVTTPCFDIAGLELFLPLVQGGRVVIASREATGNAVLLARLLDEVGATVMQATPVTWELLLESGWPGRPQLRALCGGEALAPALAAALVPCVGELWNMFGPTETTIWSTTTRVLAAGGSVPIGRPIANTTCYVLDSALRPVPIGVPGELFIGGAGLARGYINLPELTAERFVENPLPGGSGRLYRTGDTVRWRPDGQLEFFGRSDDQIKLHGFRIELGEVEAALRRLPDVARAAAAVREDGGNRRLVAYVVPAADHEPSTAGVLQALTAVLPAHMVPAQVVVLDALPLTLNGKVNRRSLPAPVSLTGPADEPLETESEVQVAELWSSLLGTPIHSRRAHFFEVGGHSLVATKLVARLREDLGVDVPLKAVFERPVLADLAALVAELAAGSPVPSPSIDLVRRNRDHHRIDAVQLRDPEALARRRAGAGASEGDLVVFPMSFAQEGLWVLEQLDPGRSLYNIPIVRRITGEVDADALERALVQLVDRHEALRTGLVDAGGVLAQVVHPDVEIALERRTTADATDPWAAAVAATTEFGLQPFALDRPPLIRARLTTTGTTDGGKPESLLCITMHHAVVDGWAIDMLMREVAALYNGDHDPSADEPLEYGDYVMWQRSDAQQAECAAQLEHWRRELEEAPPLVDLPTDRPRPALQSHRGARLLRSLDTEATSALRTLTASAGSTVFSVGLAAWSVVLSRHSGEADIVVGTPVAGRTRTALEPVVGLFTNTVPLRLQIDDGAPFLTHVGRTSEVIATALAHQDLPFDRLVDELCTRRDLSRHPIYNVMATMQTPDRRPQRLGTAEVEAEGIDWGWARFVDLSLTYIDRGSSIDVSLEYSSDLFDPETAERLVSHVEQVLVAAAAEPTSPVRDLDLVAGDERGRLLDDWNAIGRDRPQPQDVTIVDLFEAQVRAAPDAVALRFGDTVYTYAELDRRANQLAHRLVREGVGSESLVGVAMDRSARAIVTLLAVLKAGGAYVPLDPAYPEDRLRFILDDAEIAVVIADRDSAEGVPLEGRRVVWVDDASLPDEPETVPPRSAGPGNGAYVIYTSGSTGTPKGVVIEHRSIVRLVFKPNWLPDLDRPVIAQLAPIAFDASTFEIWLPLAHGGTIVGIDREVALSADDFARDLAAEGIEVLFITTALFNETVLRRADAFASLQTVLVGGEALNVRRIREVLDSHPPDRLLNVYGPTECTTFATTYVIDRSDTDRCTIPIGAGITDTTCYVLDPNRRPVPVGIPGELYLGGGGVARGYLRRPELTAERFLTDPFSPDEVMYRTGDRVRWLPTGAIEFLGRYDNQVKIRGFRIELGEVEAALRSHDGVQDAVVVVRDDLADGRRLVAYVTPSGGADAADAMEVRAFVRGRLPDYMVPSYVVAVDEIPVTRNGKLDRAALPAPDVGAGAGAFTGPRSPIEELVADAWCTVLGLSRVDVLSDFYDLGGESLSATRVISLLRDEGVTVPLRVMFDEPTVSAVARWILEDLAEGLSDDLSELGV